MERQAAVDYIKEIFSGVSIKTPREELIKYQNGMYQVGFSDVERKLETESEE